MSDTLYKQIARQREEIKQIILGNDERFLLWSGPCSVRLREEAAEYGRRLEDLARRFKDKLCIGMRVFPAKPRTTIGWKGIITDPYLDNTGRIADGLRLNREICRDIARIGLPIATEFIDPLTSPYYADLVCWGAIGARTAEAQFTREMGSMMSMPIGIKNSRDGSLCVPAEGVMATNTPHWQLGLDDRGRIAAIHSKGNRVAHVVLRGGTSGPNYSEKHIQEVLALLKKDRLLGSVLVDCSHGNSAKDYRKQEAVLYDVVRQRVEGNHHIIGAMIESNLMEGNLKDRNIALPDDLTGFDSSNLPFGVSATDGCLGWDDTLRIVESVYAML